MSFTLVRYTSAELEAERLAEELHRLVSEPDTRDHLMQRCLGGVIARHSQFSNIDHIQRIKGLAYGGKIGALAVMQGGELVGSASFLPNQMLRCKPFGRRRLQPGANVSAWLSAGLSADSDNICEVYRQLCDEYALDQSIFTDSRNAQMWTVEPQDSPQAAQDGIALAMPRIAGIGRYDGYELPPGQRKVPKGVLYTAEVRLVSDPPQTKV